MTEETQTATTETTAPASRRQPTCRERWAYEKRARFSDLRRLWRGRYYAEPLHTLTIRAGGAIEGGGFAVYGPDRALVRQMHDRTLVLVARDGSSTFLELPLPAPRYALACDAPGTGVPGRGAFERDFLAAVHVTRHHH